MKIPRTVWALGFVSMLMDISSEIVHGLLPVFLVSVLGASYTMVGLIEGGGEAVALLLKVLSGPFSDWWGKRKPLVLLGYAMGALSKPLFAIATGSAMVLGARFFDRTGKGIRGAPRDALIADATPLELRGAAFGLRQALDTVGAFLGPLLAIALMSLFSGNYRLVFWVAVIPGLLAVLVILIGVKEPELKQAVSGKKVLLSVVKELKPAFWIVAGAGAVFQLARFSEAFLILRAQNLGLALSLAPLVLVVMNIVYSLVAYPVGWLSDRMRREWLLLGGMGLLALADLCLGLGSSLFSAFAGIALWGLHLGFTQGVLAALVADTSTEGYRGTAFGMFNLLSAAALLLASALAGTLWDRYGPEATFLASAGFAILGGLVLFVAFRITSATSRTS